MSFSETDKHHRSPSTQPSDDIEVINQQASGTSNSKRSGEAGPESIKCVVCKHAKASSQFKKFPACRTKPCNLTCNFCWKIYLKVSLIENPKKEIACFECGAGLDNDILVEQFVRSVDADHYLFVRKRSGMRDMSEVECIFADCDHIQVHDSDVDGRVLTCSTCTRPACTQCMVPEHSGETCAAYRFRLRVAHGAEEDATAEAFAYGYTAVEEIGELGNTGVKEKNPVHCPGCGMWVELARDWPRVRCLACKMEFCVRCGAKYLGRNSVAEKGNAAHHPSCQCFRRSKEDGRFVQYIKGKRREHGEEDVQPNAGDGCRDGHEEASGEGLAEL